MTDYDVWLVHEYFTLYFCIHAEDKDMAFVLIPQRLKEEGLPQWVFTDAQEIKIIPIGAFV